MIQIQKCPGNRRSIGECIQAGGKEQKLCREAPIERDTYPQGRATGGAGQYVASKFTAAVLPPLMTMATRSPGAGL
jgi:hypothetical protein